MRTIKVLLRSKSGKEDSIVTDINGKRRDINKYYLGVWFCLRNHGSEHMFRAYKVIFY